MYICQCEGVNVRMSMGQRSGVLLKEISAYQRCPLTEVSP